MTPERPRRPVLRWHGGKWRLAPWILQHFPPHRIYCEPFGGAGSVLLRKKPCYCEVWNDLDGDVVNLFRVLRDSEMSTRLQELLRLTPFAREEFELSYQETDDPVEQARRLVVRAFMGFGSDGHNREQKTGFRSNSSRSGTTPALDWKNYPHVLKPIIRRLHGVVIENRDALEVMAQHDSAKTLHYVDPPYPRETRSQLTHRAKCYSHEMDEGDHEKLLVFLQGLEGMVLLSSYPNDLYSDALQGWTEIRK